MAFFMLDSVSCPSSFSGICFLQLQSFFTNLCAIMAFTEAGIKNGCTHILSILVMVSDALFVWIVDKTKCPVKDASIAISTVSLSLISHTIMISGSCLSAVLSPFANVYHIPGFTCD
jgi:hypothetical protein